MGKKDVDITCTRKGCGEHFTDTDKYVIHVRTKHIEPEVVRSMKDRVK